MRLAVGLYVSFKAIEPQLKLKQKGALAGTY